MEKGRFFSIVVLLAIAIVMTISLGMRTRKSKELTEGVPPPSRANYTLAPPLTGPSDFTDLPPPQPQPTEAKKGCGCSMKH